MQPLLHGGSQERRLRPGTLPLAQIVGLGVAADLARERMASNLEHLQGLHDRLWSAIEDLPGIRRNGSEKACFPGILNVSIADLEGESLMLALEPLCVASGSACNSQSGEASFVLKALGLDDLDAQSAIRFSFGHNTTTAEVDFAAERYRHAVSRLRALTLARAG